jgi:NAD(P)-dependent dehydrogenase (short-subunit alcohol dehydrogenase family)
MKNYLITGGNGFLGFEIAKSLIEDKNCNVFVTTRSKKEFNFKGKYTVLNDIDLLREKDVSKLSAAVDKYFEDSFTVLNCVGKYFKNGHESFLKISPEEAELIFKSNYQTVYNTAKSIIPIQIKKGGGHFIGFSCTSVKYNYPTMAAFSSAKAAMESLIKTIANEHYKDKIVSNAFQLSTLNTDFEKEIKPKGDFDNWLKSEELSNFIFNFVGLKPSIISGNVLHLYKHSDTFFSESFFNRIKK